MVEQIIEINEKIIVDDFSMMNEKEVSKIVNVLSVDDIKDALYSATQNNKKISICGHKDYKFLF